MKRFYLLLIVFTICFGNISAQKNTDAEKYMSKNPLYGFIENKGQIYDQNFNANPDVKYLLCIGNGMNVQLKKNSFSYDTYKLDTKEKNKKSSYKKGWRAKNKIEENTEITYNFHRVDIELIAANPNPLIIAEEASTVYLNYYNAVTSENGATNVRNYKKITYKDIYPGIDMIFIAAAGTDKPVEYFFELHPGADGKMIQLHYTGANETILKNNKIKVKLAHGSFTESIPASWIKETNKKAEITYKTTGKDKYAFNIPAYAKNQTLIIDPNPNLDWGTYYGGTNIDNGEKICCDKNSNIFITGITRSLNAVATASAHQSSHGGSFYDAFALKLNNNGVRLWNTYYGGSCTG